jgi:hypothetical protein
MFNEISRNTYNDVMNKLQYYILDEKYIDKCIEINVNNNKQLASTGNKPKIFVPKENDSLFWCFYIITQGDIKYETFTYKNDLYARQIKIDYVEKIRQEKKTIKIYKFDTITNIESNLVNDNMINEKTFLTLCVLENINIIYVNNNTYFELLMNDTNNIFIVYKINNRKNGNYKIKYGYELGDTETVNKIKTTLYRIDKIDKPIKAISAYTVQELTDICIKLAINTINKDNTSKTKTKTKKELYEGIIQYLQI